MDSPPSLAEERLVVQRSETRAVRRGDGATEQEQARLITDAEGVEWEVYDESAGGLGMALDWDYMPQTENPGLIFNSRVDRRRLWPCPEGWRQLTDEELLKLSERATSIT